MRRRRLEEQVMEQAAGLLHWCAVKIIDPKETTVLGASLFVQAACGNALSPEDARSGIDYKTEIIESTPLKGG